MKLAFSFLPNFIFHFHRKKKLHFQVMRVRVTPLFLELCYLNIYLFDIKCDNHIFTKKYIYIGTKTKAIER